MQRWVRSPELYYRHCSCRRNSFSAAIENSVRREGFPLLRHRHWGGADHQTCLNLCTAIVAHALASCSRIRAAQKPSHLRATSTQMSSESASLSCPCAKWCWWREARLLASILPVFSPWRWTWSRTVILFEGLASNVSL